MLSPTIAFFASQLPIAATFHALDKLKSHKSAGNIPQNHATSTFYRVWPGQWGLGGPGGLGAGPVGRWTKALARQRNFGGGSTSLRPLLPATKGPRSDNSNSVGWKIKQLWERQRMQETRMNIWKEDKEMRGV